MRNALKAALKKPWNITVQQSMQCLVKLANPHCKSAQTTFGHTWLSIKRKGGLPKSPLTTYGSCVRQVLQFSASSRANQCQFFRQLILCFLEMKGKSIRQHLYFVFFKKESPATCWNCRALIVIFGTESGNRTRTAFGHHPLKMACLPIPPSRHGRINKLYINKKQ